MSRFDTKIIGRNIKELRSSAGLSQHDFSTLIDISKRSLANCEAGTANNSFEMIKKILIFFNLSLENISDPKLKVNNSFRDQLIDFHKNNKHYLSILEKKPNLSYAIRYKLLDSEYFKSPREVTEIRSFFEKEGWKYLGTSISNALKRFSKEVDIQKHKFKDNTNTYKSKTKSF